MADHERATARPDDHAPAGEKVKETSKKHPGATTGAVMGTVAIGPLGAPIGAAIGAVVDAMTPDPNEPPTHTHDLDAPCYDGCPAWKSSKNA